mmetsp:Transcript_14910/g.48351  ORF Transcript_14910/g.48351 Transcript_14910/m.48351 type:complete len:335 (+) Transcript_14910:121-1125(+)
MTLLRALILTASLSVAATDPLAPYVFVAGVEGTGHHWFTSFFGKCKKAGECESSEVGVFEWQWVLAQIKEKPDAAQFAVHAAAAAAAREGRQPASAPRGRAKAANPRALRVLNTMGTGRKPDLVEEYRRSNITIICSASLQKKEAPNCGKFTDGEQSYPNYGGPHKPEQMPEMGFLATALGAHGQLRVVVLTRDAAAIAASVCDHRHFGGPGPSACAKELELLSKAARLIAAQVAALPATVLCDHYDQEDLTDATRGGLARLGAYLEIDAPTFAAATNAGHAPSKPEPPHPERDALVAALKEAQEGAAAACRARGAASSEAKLDAAVAKLDSDT